jgi:hypothetical protein
MPQIDDAEDYDPNDVDEVPVVAHRDEGGGGLCVEVTAHNESKNRRERNQANQDVKTVKACQCKECRREQVS